MLDLRRTFLFTLALLTLTPLAACDGEAGAGPDDASGIAGQGAAGAGSGGGGTTGAAGTGAASDQTLSFLKDGAAVAVDFKKWGTPAYYQKTAAGWTLAVVA